MKVAAACLLVVSASSAIADPIGLACSGKWWQPESKIVEAPVTVSFLVDIENKTVQSSLGVLGITRVDEREIGLRGIKFDGTKKVADFYGSIDRISGLAVLNGTRDEGKTYFVVYNLNCRITKPLF